MKTITITNWVVISIWVIFILFSYFSTKGSGMDAAGRGMAMGYLMIVAGYAVILIILNLINVKSVQIIVFLMAVIPIAYFGLQSISSKLAYSSYKKKIANLGYFEDTHMNNIALAIQNRNPEETSNLLAQDNSKINQISNLRYVTLLDMTVQTAISIQTPELQEIVDILLKNEADPNVRRPQTESILVKNVNSSSVELFQKLLEAGANPNDTSQYGSHLLYLLLDRGREDKLEKVKILIEKGVDPNTPFTASGYPLNFSALTEAASQRRWDICEFLINNGADLNYSPSNGSDFWEYIAYWGHDYQEAGEVPEDYQKLLENPKVKAGRK